MFRSKKKLEKQSSVSQSVSSSSSSLIGGGGGSGSGGGGGASSRPAVFASASSGRTSKLGLGLGLAGGGGRGNGRGSPGKSTRRFFKSNSRKLSSSSSSVVASVAAAASSSLNAEEEGQGQGQGEEEDNRVVVGNHDHGIADATDASGGFGGTTTGKDSAAIAALSASAAAIASNHNNDGSSAASAGAAMATLDERMEGLDAVTSNHGNTRDEEEEEEEERQQQQQQQQQPQQQEEEEALIQKDLFQARQEMTTVARVVTMKQTEAFQPTLPLPDPVEEHNGHGGVDAGANAVSQGGGGNVSSRKSSSRSSRRRWNPNTTTTHQHPTNKSSGSVVTKWSTFTALKDQKHKEEKMASVEDTGTSSATTFYFHDDSNMQHTTRKKYTLKDPTDTRAVSELVTYLVPKKMTSVMNYYYRMDPSSTPHRKKSLDSQFYNECLFVSRVHQYKLEHSKNVIGGNNTMRTIHHGGGQPGVMGTAKNTLGTSTSASTSTIANRLANTMASIKGGKKQKVYHVCITRLTNSILDWQHRTMTCRGVCLNGVLIVNGLNHYYHNDGDGDDDGRLELEGGKERHGKKEDDDDDDEEDDDDDNDDYSLLYNPHHQQVKDVALEHTEKDNFQQDDDDDDDAQERLSLLKARTHKGKQKVPPELEQSSFPSLVFFEIYSDGTHPEIVQVLDLDQLVAIENVANSGVVKLVFQNGVTVELDCDLDRTATRGQPTNSVMVADDGAFLNKNRFLWSLLQIHAILCTSVVERKMRMGNTTTEPLDAAYSRVQVATVLPQVQMRNVDKAELQYISTVNGFLSENPILFLLLERQKILARGMENRTVGTSSNRHKDHKDGIDADVSSYFDEAEEKKSGDYLLKDEVDDIAYDMIMGNFNRLTLFFSEEEKQDAEDVLNTATLKELVAHDGKVMQDVDFNEADTAGVLMQLLQKRMRDLEAETCRRLIAWEDGKKHSISTSGSSMFDTVESQSLSSLFHTLDKLDSELEDMEEWLADKAAAIKPLTDECRKVEEVNRQLEQQKRSFDLLSDELERLLGGLELDPEVEAIIKDPSSKLTFLNNGDIDLANSEGGVQEIYNAGKLLKMTFDKVFQEGGIHLRAVNERAEGLSNLSTLFCQSVADIIVSVMRRAISEATNDDKLQADKAMNHVAIAKSIRNMQRRFQTSLLAFIKLIEVLALLKPSILTTVRESYAEIVSEGVLSKKRLKNYFDALPGKASSQWETYTIDLSNYQPVALRSTPITDPNNSQMKPAQAKGVEIALSEILPVIAREAYFTAALFGLSAKHLSGREKKQNFESAKKSVDYSSRHFKYFITRICGIASDADDEGRKVFADPMLSLISSIYLNEAMDNYIDRQRKGGEHSLSLAYVRATILDLRKKVDKQWVAWIEEQIKWVHTNPGVPLNGKRAGIFTSFARFPSYLDHVMICCKVGRPKDQIPNLSRIKVITYYLQKLAASLFNSLHECSERESTDQQYAANVMRMENSYFFTQTIKQRGPELVELFQKQITAASSICKQSTDAYLGFMIKREFKSLHTLFASISRIRREVGDSDVPIHVPRSTFEKTLSKESNKEILKEKIGTIYYRMEKHLSEAGGLLPVAWKALVKVLYEWFGRWEKLSSQCYKFSLEPSANDVVRIAKQAAGASAKKINEEKSQKNKLSSAVY